MSKDVEREVNRDLIVVNVINAVTDAYDSVRSDKDSAVLKNIDRLKLALLKLETTVDLAEASKSD